MSVEIERRWTLDGQTVTTKLAETDRARAQAIFKLALATGMPIADVRKRMEETTHAPAADLGEAA